MTYISMLLKYVAFSLSIHGVKSVVFRLQTCKGSIIHIQCVNISDFKHFSLRDTSKLAKQLVLHVESNGWTWHQSMSPFITGSIVGTTSREWSTAASPWPSRQTCWERCRTFGVWAIQRGYSPLIAKRITVLKTHAPINRQKRQLGSLPRTVDPQLNVVYL